MSLRPEAKRIAVYGVGVGLLGALVSWATDLAFRDLGFSLDGLVRSHQTNPVIWLADLMPLLLAGLGAWVGQRSVPEEESDKKVREADRRTRAATRDSDALKTLVDGVIFEKGGTIREANAAAARILGLSKEALEHEPLERFLPKVHEANAGEPVIRGTGYGEVLGMAWLHDALDAEGRELKLEVASALLGSGEHVLHVFRDVTDEIHSASRQRRMHRSLVDARDRAEAKNDGRRAFLAGTAHALRTPLASMLGYLELLGEEAEERGLKQAFADLGRVRTSAEQVLDLVNKIHDQTMIEAGKLSLFLVPVDCAELCAEVTDMMRGLLGPNVSLVVNIADGLPCIRADRGRLRQILLSLLTNAARFTTAGSVSIDAVALDSDEVQIEITDTGSGIPADDIDQLFEPFEGRRPGRTGLGLVIGHELAKLMNGQLTVDSTVGEGTTFRLVLPAALDMAKTERLVKTRSRVGRGRVLVLADDPHVRGLLEARLGARGLQVLSAASSLSAAESADALLPSAIVADLGLVRKDPWNELALLTASGPLARVPVHGVAVRGGKGVWLPLGGVLGAPPDRKRLQERSAAIGNPERAVVIIGGGRGASRPLNDVGWTVVEPEGAVGDERYDDAGLIVVDLLANEAVGLKLALDHAGNVPLLGLLPAAPTDADRAAARRVLAEAVEAHGEPEEAVIEKLLQVLTE